MSSSGSSVIRKRIQNLTLSAVLTAFSILIPMIMPVKVIIGPASFTLASHVPIFIAIFLSPEVAVIVALGTSLGFFIAGFPFVIVMRALTHLIFAAIGAYLIQKYPSFLKNFKNSFPLAFGLNIIHGLGEFLVVLLLTTTNQQSTSYWFTLIVLIGLGSLIHGMIDFYLAYYCWKFLKKTGRI